MLKHSNLFVGFDRLFNEIASIENTAVSNYPPHNILTLSKDKTIIEIAVAGFSEDDLRIEHHNNRLTILGDKKKNNEDTEAQYTHRGIANRAFTKRFLLGEYVLPVSCTYQSGILSITLERCVPEEAKPKTLKINSASTLLG